MVNAIFAPSREDLNAFLAALSMWGLGKEAVKIDRYWWKHHQIPDAIGEMGISWQDVFVYWLALRGLHPSLLATRNAAK